MALEMLEFQHAKSVATIRAEAWFGWQVRNTKPFSLAIMVALVDSFGNWGKIETRFAKMHSAGTPDAMG